MRRITITAVLLAIVLPAFALAAPAYKCSFSKNGWDAKDWIAVRDQGKEFVSSFVQRDGCIENKVPEGLTPDKLQKSHETWACMMYSKKVGPSATVRAVLEFDYRMCPTIVLAPDLGKSAKGEPELHTAYEICVYDQGVNVWLQSPKDGKPDYTKACFAKFPLRPKTRYAVEAAFKPGRRGRILTITVREVDTPVAMAPDAIPPIAQFGFHAPELPDQFHVGIAAMEGLNRFYNFRVGK